MKDRRYARFGLALDSWGRCDLILCSAARLILGGAAVYRCDNDLGNRSALAAEAAQRRGKNPEKNYKLKSGSLKT
jgi:hypothetical protein